MTITDELSLCDCCALVVANGDESGCRDYYGHTHAPAEVPFHTAVDGDPIPSPRGFTCDGCGEGQGAYANEWPAVVLS